MKIGTTNIIDYKVGTESVSKIYLGTDLVWPTMDVSLNYIESDGYSYINLGNYFIPSQHIYQRNITVSSQPWTEYYSIEMDLVYQFPDYKSSNYIMGCRGADNGWFTMETLNHNTYLNFNNSTGLALYPTVYNTQRTVKNYIGYYYIAWSGGGYTPTASIYSIINGTTYSGGDYSIPYNNVPNNPLILFGSGAADGGVGYITNKPGQRIYSMKITSKSWRIKNDESDKVNYADAVILDLVPVLHNRTACLYDKVNQVYFENQGSGTFLYG